MNIYIWGHRSLSSPQALHFPYVVSDLVVNLGKEKWAINFSWYLGIFVSISFISNFEMSFPISRTDKLWKYYNLVWKGSITDRMSQSRTSSSRKNT